MEAIEHLERINRLEDSYTQFKVNVTNADSLAGDFAAFSNSNDGIIYVGVRNDGEIIGLTAADIDRINQLISNTATECVRPSIAPKTENIPLGGKLIIAITVKKGVSRPYSDHKGVYWVKSGADKRRVTSREELQRMFQSATLVHADEVPVEGATTNDIDIDKFSAFFKKQYGDTFDNVLERDNISLTQTLNNFGLAKGETLTLAGLMLFGRNPQHYRPAFIVKAVAFVGNDPAGERYRDSQDIKGCLRDLYKGTIDFLKRNLRYLQNDKGFNTEGDLEIPLVALEELLVNMLLHRDYFISAPWRVMIFDNRVELISPGALPNNITIANIRSGVSVIRNPLIASYATKDPELPYRGIGTGIRRAIAALPAIDLESDYERNLFIANIPRLR